MPAGFSLFTKDFARSVHHPRLAVAIREAIQEDFGKPPTKCALLSPEAVFNIVLARAIILVKPPGKN